MKGRRRRRKKVNEKKGEIGEIHMSSVCVSTTRNMTGYSILRGYLVLGVDRTTIKYKCVVGNSVIGWGII